MSGAPAAAAGTGTAATAAAAAAPPPGAAVSSNGSGRAPLLGDVVPDFDADTTRGRINFHDYIRGRWAILFSHPNDYTPVCTTELGEVGRLRAEFEARGVAVLALSCNGVESHQGWAADIEAYTAGCSVWYPIVADPGREIAVKYGMLDPDERDARGDALTARAVFFVGPDARLKASLLYPATTGRSFPEVLRVIDSLQLTAAHSVATPANWQRGGACMVVPTLSDEEARAKFPKGFETAQLPSGRGYLRVTPQPDP